MGGNRGSNWEKVRNLFLVFLLSGLWHGANWTFVAWGVLHALFFLPLIFLPTASSPNHNRIVISLKVCFTFSITTLAWVFFRAENMTQALNYYQNIVSNTFISKTALVHLTHNSRNVFIIFLFLMEWRQRKRPHALDFSQTRLPWYARWTIYYLLILAMATLRSNAQTFIYFQF